MKLDFKNLEFPKEDYFCYYNDEVVSGLKCQHPQYYASFQPLNQSQEVWFKPVGKSNVSGSIILCPH